jgi:hypothetical protein
MRASLLKETIKSLFPIQRTICIEGSPGGGKTTIVQQAAEELGVPCIERHMPTMLVEDFGILFPETGSDTLHYKLPEWFPVKGKAPERGILLFDDRNQAGPDLQKVLANICQARNLHGVSMPDGWQVVSTGNRQSDRAGANRVLSHLRNRETAYELETHLDDWTVWAINNNVKSEVVSFIRFRPNLLHDFDPQRDQNATPRAWVEGVSDVLGTVPAEAEFESFKGAVGEGAAAEFVGFVRIFRKLPNPDAILLNPTTSDVPSDPATLYALSGALAQRATEGNFERVCTYSERMPPEFSVLTVSYAARRNPDLANTQAFTKWSINHQNVLF